MEHLHNTTFIKQMQDERDSLPLWTPPCCAHPRPTFLLSQQSHFETATDMDGHLYTGDTYVEPDHPISPVEQVLFFDEFSNHHHIFGTGTTLLLIMIIVLLCCCLPSLHSSCSTCLPTVCTHPVENWKDKRSLKRTQEQFRQHVKLAIMLQNVTPRQTQSAATPDVPAHPTPPPAPQHTSSCSCRRSRSSDPHHQGRIVSFQQHATDKNKTKNKTTTQPNQLQFIKLRFLLLLHILPLAAYNSN